MLLSLRIDRLIEKLSHLLINNGWKLAAAESCSGGLLAAKMTAISGASNWFETSIVSYSEYAKMRVLGVTESTLKTHGAVSEACALEMVKGAKLADNNLVVAITGFAGPDGGSASTPVGSVFIAWCAPDDKAYCQSFMLMGSRHEVVLQAIFFAVRGCVLESLCQMPYQSMHYFFAIMIEEQTLQNAFYQHALDAGFNVEQLEPASHLHITLAFLGKMDGQDLVLIKQKACELANSTLPFTLDFSDLVYWQKPQAFVYLLQETPRGLKKLSLLTNQESYTPHVTICKRSHAQQESIQTSVFSATMRVKSFSLMASIDGLIYIEQDKWFLNKEIK